MKDSKGTPVYDDSEVDREIFSLHNELSTQLSLSISNGVLLNGSAASPGPGKNLPSDIPHWSLKNLKQDPDKENVTKWSVEKNGFPFDVSDSELYAESSYDSSASEQSSAISSPCMSLAAYSDTRSEDFDRTDIWVTSLDLDEEDSALLPDKEQFLDTIFSSDFPSPSFTAIRRLQLGSSSPNPGTSQREEASDSNDPIFWPFEWTSYNSPEFDKFLSISPRRETLGTRSVEARQLNPVQRLQKSKLSSAMKNTELHRSSIDLASKGRKASQDNIKKVATVPSRLSRPAKASASSNHQPIRNCEKKRPPHLKLAASRKFSSPQLHTDQPLVVTKAERIRKLGEKKSAIEELIGLGEFDGHEGISSDSTDCQLSLWLSPR